MFVRELCDEDLGVYTLRFWKNGAWTYVSVDDRIPFYEHEGPENLGRPEMRPVGGLLAQPQ